MNSRTHSQLIEHYPTNYVAALKRILEQFCSLLRDNGVTVEPHTPGCLVRFAGYPVAVQEKIYRDFIKYVSAVLEIVEDGIPLENTEQSLWCIFKKHGLKPRPDLFSSVARSDMVQIYLPNHVQWYRSFNFFRYSSYSLGELVCVPWFELYEHQNSHMEVFMEITEGIFANRIHESVAPNLGATVSKELFSSRQLVASLEARVLSPLMGADGTNEAFVVSWKIDLLGGATLDGPYHSEMMPLTSLQLVLPPANHSENHETT